MFVSGDSWTSCWPLEERLGHRNFGWPSLVAKHFDFELIDKSRAGSSNYRIYRKAFDGLFHNVDLVIVFLTSWSRFETGAMFGPKPGGIYQHLPTDVNYKKAFELFFNGYKNYTDILRQIISLQAIAKTRNIPCFFLDTYSNNLHRNITLDQFKTLLKYNIGVFDNIDDQRINNKFQIVKRLESNIDWSSFLSEHSYSRIVQKCKMEKGHPLEDGHYEIAKVVIKFLESTKYGKTI